MGEVLDIVQASRLGQGLEAAQPLKQAVAPVWHESEDLLGCDVILLPGGFSYGDYLRAGAIARFSPVLKAVKRFASQGGLVMGICNGFQILVEAGLLPGVLTRNQGLLFRCVDVVMELFAMTAAMSHARRLKDLGRPEGKEAIELADLFCRQARRRVQRSFRDLWSNEDATLNKVAGNVMQGRHEWLGQGRMDLGFTAESFRTRYISESKTEEKPRVAAAS